MTPFWLQLLRAHNKQGGYGLTFPFIVGAYLHNDGHKLVDLDKIKNIVTSIAIETPDESYVTFKECDRLRHPVFAESHRRHKISDIYIQIKSPDSDECSLFVPPVIFNSENATIGGFSKHFYQKYNKELLNNNFSYFNGSFNKFNDQDYEKISLAKALDDEI